MTTTVKLYVPGIGEPLKLVEPWAFRLYYESRNYKLLEKLGLKETLRQADAAMLSTGNYYSWRRGRALPSEMVTLPAGMTLACRRIYIRQNLEDFNSLTFSITDWPDKESKQRYGKARFWAKLFDVNQMVVDVPDDVRYAGLVRHATRQMLGADHVDAPALPG